MRFGIGCEREHTLEEIGQEFDVTRDAFARSKQKRYASCARRSGPGGCVR